jgi:hypothetical protein
MKKHEYDLMKSAFNSAQKACEWIQREAHWGCLPNMDSPRSEGEECTTTMDAVDSAQNFLNYLKYDLKEDEDLIN